MINGPVTDASWSLPGSGLRLGRPAAVMGIINATPDSFSDGGTCQDPLEALQRAREMAAAGACCLDVGGESTRPGAGRITVQEECQRVVPVVTALAQALPGMCISVDTSKATVAAAACAQGARMVNDVTAGRDPELFAVTASAGADLVLMHMQGTPAGMQDDPTYDDVVDEVSAFFEDRIAAAQTAGVAETGILLDPGIGFGKRLEDNLALLRALPCFARRFGRPLVVGISRKSLIPAIVGCQDPPDRRDGPSHVLHGLLAERCALLRVHDVPGAMAAVRLALAISGDAA